MVEVDLLYRHSDRVLARGGGPNAPPSVALSWPRPNYIDPQTHDWSGTIVVIIVLALCVAVFTARIWARLALAKNAGLDDLIMSLAMFPLFGMSVAVVLGKNCFYAFA
jgi:hypothetical protein